MKSSRQPTAHSSNRGAGCNGGVSRVSGCRLSAVSRTGAGRHGNRPAPRTLTVALALALAFLVGGRAVAEGQYLAVFVDGRILRVSGARAVDASRIHLDLPGGGSIDVPLTRVDRVIADEVEEKPAPIPKPTCSFDYADQPLPAGTPFAGEIRRASRQVNLHPRLVAAVVATESAFRPFAVSPVGAAGLMQLMPSVWVEQRLTRPFEPGPNLLAGCRHLRALLDRFADPILALAAYNAGVAVVEKSGGVPPYRETRQFIRRVMERFCASGAEPAGD